MGNLYAFIHWCTGSWYLGLRWFERLILIAAGLAMIYPESLSDLTGLAVFGVMWAIQLYTKNKNTPSKPQVA